MPHGADAELRGDAYMARHYPEGHYPDGHYPGDHGPEVIEVLELDDDEVVAEPADGEPLSEEAVTERGFDASTFGLPRAGGTKLPMASLEMPSASRLDLTPSPVPRVALTPATGAVDISLVPGPHASRNLPTLAAHHVLGRRPARRPASAITFPPPHHRGSGESPRLGAGLAKDVRSSKREIVLGLAIGLGLSLVLAAVGQAYLRDEPVAGSQQPEVESLALSAMPEAAAAPASSAQVAEDLSASAAAQAAVSHTAVAERAASSLAATSQALAARPRRAPASDGLDEPTRVASASRAELERSSSARSSAGMPTEPRAVARRAHARHDGASPGAAPRASSNAEQASRKSQDASRAYDEPPPPRAPLAPVASSPASLSPAESAGLGLDLPL